MQRVIAARRHKPMFLIDIRCRAYRALRNEIDNIFLYDIDICRTVVDAIARTDEGGARAESWSPKRWIEPWRG